MAEALIPASWEDLAKQTDDAIALLEAMQKTPLPESVSDAAKGNYFAASTGILETLLGHTTRDEMREWGTRVMSLQRANAILREFESGLVKAYVLSPASAFRLIYERLIKVPRWIMEHLAELTLILWPLLLKIGRSFEDEVMIYRAIDREEANQLKLKKQMGLAYAETPGTGMFLNTDEFGNQFLDGTGRTKEEILDEIKFLEDAIESSKRTIKDLEGLLRKAGNALEFAMQAIFVFLIYLTVQKLLAVAGSVSEALVSLTPVRKLRDEAMQKAKNSAFPQGPDKRTWVQKRSRRN